MDPCEAGALYPPRRVSNSACMHVEGGAHSNQKRCIESVQMLSHKKFLFRSTQTNPNDIRFQPGEKLGELFLFLVVQRPEGRRISTDHLQPGVALAENIP